MLGVAKLPLDGNPVDFYTTARQYGRAYSWCIEVGPVIFFQKMPGNEFRELHPAVLRVKLATKWQVEIGKFGLIPESIHAH